MTSGLIRRGRHERCISLERWWSPTRSDFYLQKRPILPIAAKCVRRHAGHPAPIAVRTFSIAAAPCFLKSVGKQEILTEPIYA